jgi:hypothetical protein
VEGVLLPGGFRPPNRAPAAGPAVVGVVAADVWPNRPPAGAAAVVAPPPKRPPAGFAAAVFPPPNREEGVVVDWALPVLPKRPPAGAEAAGVLEALAPKRPPVAGVVLAAPESAGLAPKRPPDAGVLDPDPNRPPGFGAAEFPPNRPPPEVGVAVPEPVPAVLLEPTLLKEKLGAPVAAPNKPPEAGAEGVLDWPPAAPLAFVFPKLKDISAVGIVVTGRCSGPLWLAGARWGASTLGLCSA